MKIGIVTQPLYANYGGILQNYALQQVLKQMGHDPVTLDYMPSLSLGRYILYAGKGLLCALSPNKRHPIKPYHHYLQRPASIDSFVCCNINLTRTIPEYNKRLLEKNGIEALIVGSDQVWRYSYNSHYLEDMYLAFAKDYPCIKLAYAASFGVEKWDYPAAKTFEAKELIKQFRSVSVRENSAAHMCQEIFDVKAQVVLDPTLLLDASDYERFCSRPELDSSPYLAAYILDMNEEKEVLISTTAKERGLAIKKMSVSEKSDSIEEWLSTIRNAEYIITDSYHGCLFSLLFNKQFRVLINKERGEDRFLTLFERLGIKDSVPDYDLVKSQLNEFRKQSIRFLLDSLCK